jgi:tRNA-dihydrouridine synthase B
MMINDLVKNKLWLAPLAGFTDMPFRFIAKLCGADVLVSEMVSADGVKRNFDKMKHYTAFSEDERPFGIQLFGDNPEIMSKAAHLLSILKPDFFDINMGCPVKKVVKRYAGSALMLKQDLAEEIIKKVSNISSSEGILLTVKFRSGWDFNSLNYLEFSQMCESAGADAICIHPRTRSQFFSGESDWNIIKQIKESVKIPVIGNGDINSSADAQKMFKTTLCDSVMIGRGALGKPWIFNEIKDDNFKIDISKKINIIYSHIDKVLEHSNNDLKALLPLRAHLAFYTKGFPDSAEARKKIFTSLNVFEIKETIKNLMLENS